MVRTLNQPFSPTPSSVGKQGARTKAFESLESALGLSAHSRKNCPTLLWYHSEKNNIRVLIEAWTRTDPSQRTVVKHLIKYEYNNNVNKSRRREKKGTMYFPGNRAKLKRNSTEPMLLGLFICAAFRLCEATLPGKFRLCV